MDLPIEENWYHGAMNREEADICLMNFGSDSGIFLVRDSSTSIGDFVLSVVVNTNKIVVVHYQIRRHAHDALFSLSEDDRIIHGLDELIMFYLIPNSGLQHPLGPKFVPGRLAPPTARLHGTENLLHRSAFEGESNVVRELLASGYRNVAARNHDGQTAVHLAAMKGHIDILDILLSYDAMVNVANVDGSSPLHVAAQFGQTQAISFLLSNNNIDKKADPTFRNKITGWVALHEAASNGHLESVKALINGHAPLKPRTDNNETPADIAIANGHLGLANFLNNFKPSAATSSIIQCYHPNATRVDAVNTLVNDGKKQDGAYLIRHHSQRNSPDNFVLSMCYDNQYYHFEIEKFAGHYFLDKGPYMASLEHILDHYARFADGLPTELRIPLPASSLLKHCSSSIRSKVDTDCNKSKKKCESATLPSKAKLRNEAKFSVTDRSIVPRQALKFEGLIGEGEFGRVFRGKFQGEDVAIKILPSLTDMSEDETSDFHREAVLMMTLSHPCIVRLLGLCSGPPLMMVLEMVPLGSILDYLLDNASSITPQLEMIIWSTQIVHGMSYLQEQRFVHRDLAARNVLLESRFKAKISDFGLSRALRDGKDYYRASKGGRWPIKWYAPECINYGTFSHASDVWSFGVLLWELFSFGDTPYENLSGAETFEFIETGGRLAYPAAAVANDGVIAEIMSKCWSYEPNDRPSFHNLYYIFVRLRQRENNVYQELEQDLNLLEL